MVSSRLNRGSSPLGSTLTRLLSTSELSVSITGPWMASPQMAATAGRPKLPANTASRVNRACSSADSRPKLQSSVFRRVRWRSGRSRGPAVSRLIRSPSRASSARGDSSLIRAAASSMASGRPSSRRQISATSWAFSLVSSKPGASARARAANKRTEAACAGSREPRGGTGSAGTTNSYSPLSRSTVRLATRTTSPGAAASSSATTGAPSMTCSKLSRTSKSRLVRRYDITSPASRSPEVFSPSPAAIAAGTRSAVRTGARSTNRTPSANWGASRPAAATARRVFPTPPGPVRVIRRTPWPITRSSTLAASDSRSTSGVAGTGRAPASTASGARPGGRVTSKRSLNSSARSFSIRRCSSAGSEKSW